MKNKNRTRNLVLAGGLILLYVATYLISLLTAQPIALLNLIATVGVALGAAVLLNRMPTAYFAAILMFAFAAQYLGMMFDLYHTLWWYDVAVHFLSGFLLGAIGYYFCGLLCRKADVQPPLALAVLSAVFFAIGCAGLWEVYEYCADRFFGLSSQHGMGQTPLDDTMQDIIAGSLSAVLYGCGVAVGRVCARRQSAVGGKKG